MTRFPKELTENGIHYTLHGDCYFPDLDLPDSPRQTISHYGWMRKAYLEEHRSGLYERLLLSGKLYDHLAETDQGMRGVEKAKDLGIVSLITYSDIFAVQ